ncbi:MAG: signal peptide peptidase SppA [Pseudomonadota bacterium]
MALDVDTVLDRRRLRRRIALWRGLAILVIIGAIAAVAVTQTEITGTKHVARISVSGPILNDRAMMRLIKRLEKSSTVSGVLVAINSPGGTSVGGETLFNALRALDAKKPVVAHINTLGASAAYMTALASDHIVAQRTSLTGSIGVLIQYGQISDMLDHLGIKVRKVDSGPLKAEPNPFEPAPPAAIAALQSVVDDTYKYFLDLVIERRSMPSAKARGLADGRIFTGAQALEEGLIDEIGGEDAAIAWLTKERDVPKGLPVRNYKPRREGTVSLVSSLSERVANGVLSALGITVSPNVPMGSVDGLWAIWQAPDIPGATGAQQ